MTLITLYKSLLFLQERRRSKTEQRQTQEQHATQPQPPTQTHRNPPPIWTQPLLLSHVCFFCREKKNLKLNSTTTTTLFPLRFTPGHEWFRSDVVLLQRRSWPIRPNTHALNPPLISYYLYCYILFLNLEFQNFNCRSTIFIHFFEKIIFGFVTRAMRRT